MRGWKDWPLEAAHNATAAAAAANRCPKFNLTLESNKKKVERFHCPWVALGFAVLPLTLPHQAALSWLRPHHDLTGRHRGRRHRRRCHCHHHHHRCCCLISFHGLLVMLFGNVAAIQMVATARGRQQFSSYSNSTLIGVWWLSLSFSLSLSLRPEAEWVSKRSPSLINGQQNDTKCNRNCWLYVVIVVPVKHDVSCDCPWNEIKRNSNNRNKTTTTNYLQAFLWCRSGHACYLWVSTKD